MNMKILLTSIFVDDQKKALKFYTNILRFSKKSDYPIGKNKWLTVVSPEDPDGTELLLEPNDNQDAKTFQQAIYKDGIPAKSFWVRDIRSEYERMKKLGVKFESEPAKIKDGTIITMFDDTCGNYIQLYQN